MQLEGLPLTNPTLNGFEIKVGKNIVDGIEI
jgi:hypothetical protein